MNGLFPGLVPTKRKVFISYYHKEDQPYKDAFERAFGHLFINKSVGLGDINTDVSTEYIKQLIQSDDYLAGASVVVVLCGPNTLKRKHVDWEIWGGLSKKLSGRSGLMGIMLPTFLRYPNGNYDTTDLPARLADNSGPKSEFASVYHWNDVTSSEQNIKNAIEAAFQKRGKDELVDNSRLQMQHNLN